MLNILADVMLVATGQPLPIRRPDAAPHRPVRETDTRRGWFKLVGLRF